MRFELIWGLYIPLLQILSILIYRLLSFSLPSHPYSSLHFHSFSFLFFPFLSFSFFAFPTLLFSILPFLSFPFPILSLPTLSFPSFPYLLWYLKYRFALILCCRIIYSLLTSATSPHRLKCLLLISHICLLLYFLCYSSTFYPPNFSSLILLIMITSLFFFLFIFVALFLFLFISLCSFCFFRSSLFPFPYHLIFLFFLLYSPFRFVLFRFVSFLLFSSLLFSFLFFSFSLSGHSVRTVRGRTGDADEGRLGFFL